MIQKLYEATSVDWTMALPVAGNVKKEERVLFLS